MSLVLSIVGMPVRFVPWMAPGTAYVIAEPPMVIARHESEYLLMWARATWHVHAGHCPTWDNATECRCMLGGEA